MIATLIAATNRNDTFGVDPDVVSGIDVSTLANINLTMLFAVLGLAALSAAAVFGVAYALRQTFIRRSHIRGGANATVTFMLTVPRYTNDAQAQAELNVAQVKEQIAVAETLFAAIGGLKPHKGVKAWFLGRTDAVTFEIVAFDKVVTFYVTVPKYMREFVEQQARSINGGIVKPGLLVRTWNSEKFSYTDTTVLEQKMHEFYEEFSERLHDPHQDPIELAAWVVYRMDLTDHFFADGCGKISKAISYWVLMRVGHSLPRYRRDVDMRFRQAHETQGTEGELLDREQFAAWFSMYRTLFTDPPYPANEGASSTGTQPAPAPAPRAR